MAIKVLKRNGDLEELDITKIQKQTKDAVDGLDNVSQSELELDAQIQFQNGMNTEDIQETLVKTAVDKIDVDKPDWTFVASRLFLYDLYHKVGHTIGGTKGKSYSHIKKYFDYAEGTGRVIKGLSSKYDLDDLDSYIDPKRDFQFNYMGVKTLYDRYLLKDQAGNNFELPQHMFMAIAMFLSQNEKVAPKDILEGFKFQFGSETSEYYKAVRGYWAKKFYDLISKFEVMLATPTLSNARTPRHQLSSCYIGSTPDNIEGIFDSYKEMGLLSKFGGGLGWDWNHIRGISAGIDGHKGAAGGIVPFLKITNDIALAVDQLGTRKGAIAVYAETWHIDINDFLDLKKNSGEERRRAHDLFPALWISDLFMKRIDANENWTLFSPDDVPLLSETYGEKFEKAYLEYEKDDTIPREVVKAKDLWKKILLSYFETGSPFLGFKDNANRRNAQKEHGIIRSSNLCTEIFQNTSPNKYLMKFEFEDGTFITANENDMISVNDGEKRIAKKVTALDILDGKQIYMVEKERVDGETAVCNLASINLSKINTKEDIERVVPIAIRMLDNVIDLNFYPFRKVKDTNKRTRAIGLGVMGEAQMLAEKAIMYGTDEHFNLIDEVMEAVSYNAILSSHELGLERGSYPQFENSEWSKGIVTIDTIPESVKELTNRDLNYNWGELRDKVKSGMRNAYLMAVAPTSSISILTGTTQAIEPVYKRKYFEENLSGLIPIVAPNMSPETYQYYIPAYDLDQVILIKAGAIRQKWIDQGQSLNIFVKLANISAKKLNEIYMLAWKLGVKSTYYLRSESPEAKSDVVDRSIECNSCQ
jgi:ribonucleoside-diphosphate reductase alpha chain